MTITEYRPLPVERPLFSTLAEQRCFDAPALLDTTELRWFVPGLLPAAVDRWFVGSTGVLEERCDTYLLDGRDDVGVKRRSRETLEVKVRQSLDGRMQLGAVLDGQLEAWRKWSPAAGLVVDGPVRRQVDVCKSIVKRRFSMNGAEIAFSSNAPVVGAGCDVEVATVTVGARQAWTFAFAAFGPQSTRRGSLLASWQRLVTATQRPKSLALCSGQSMGYPEWLALTLAPSVDETDPLRTMPASLRQL